MCPDEEWPEIARRPPGSVLELAGSLRRLTEELLRVPALPEELATEVRALAGQADALAGRLAPHAREDRLPQMRSAMGGGAAEGRPYYVRGPIIGEHHPAQPLFDFQHEPGRSFGRVRFGVTYEGPPGCVHGGWVAFFFDEVLGEHNVRAAIPAMTGTLTVRYNQATPLLTELDFEVRSQSHGPRKVLTSGTLSQGDEVFAEAEGLFIIPRTALWSPEDLGRA